jgi:hypothetical protein
MVFQNQIGQQTKIPADSLKEKNNIFEQLENLLIVYLSRRMNKRLIIKNLTIKNVFNLGGPLLFLCFILYCAIEIGFSEGILGNLLIFLYTVGSILAINMINYFSEVVTIDRSGIERKSLFFSHFIRWKDIKSLDVELITGNKFTKVLNKKEYFENFYIGRKEILISDLENQLEQSTITKWRKMILLPFNEETIEILRNNNNQLL